ncbi:transaldolase [Atopomonas sediminilitoris]|uniref:transaldolase n=1 Tax=Atopomonas sediminilitoris TaxID=2919919 RepID=UPI001F4E6423|nr:transaldolase [Atopomonas sediminilitoris]MCJ8170787.1 transaldolase [Atopomonas sediminilitoris]
MTSKLEQLRSMTTVVADTGDLEAIAKLTPVDATTNPSLLLKAAQLPRYADALNQARQLANGDVNRACDLFAVSVGEEILRLIPGRVSTEVDARLSFDSEASYAKAMNLVELYNQRGINNDRLLIKIAATWEGIKAAERLEKAGVQCNLTLLFSFAQACACADANVTLISPFVGRIYDWHKQQTGINYQGIDDPGVQSVSRIYRYYKQNDYQTIVMGASFRNIGQIEALAGCDRLTISPALLEALAADSGQLSRALNSQQTGEAKQTLSEACFRWEHNEDAMATEKLAEGIRLFAIDQVKLEKLLS